MLCSNRGCALQDQRLCSASEERGLCFGAPGSALQHQSGFWNGEGRGQGFVLWSTRLSFAAPEKMGGKKGVVLCARGGEGRGEGFALCSARGDGGRGRKKGGGALQRQEIGTRCFAA